MTTEYTELDQVRHMLSHPERDLGDTTIHLVLRYLLDPETMSLSCAEIPYSTAIERLFQEILYNAVDNTERSRKDNIDPGCIRVWMSKNVIRIRNEGKPISCGLQPHRNIHKPEFIFSNLLTGSNFGGESRKVQTVGGRFGIGGKAANIFSSYFEVDIGNSSESLNERGEVVPTPGGVRYRQVWRNNMYVVYRPEESDTEEIKRKKQEEYRSKIRPTIEKYSGPSYTQITFQVDFARFYDEDISYGFSGQREYTPAMMMAYAKHCADASVTGNVKVYFNDKEIDCTDGGHAGEGLYKYARLYFPEIPQHLLFRSSDSLCLLLDTPLNGTTISFVNGVINEEGGVHVDAWRKTLFKGILHHFKKKYKVTEKIVSQHISMILLCRLPNPKYKSQTKDKVTSPKPVTGIEDVDGNPQDMDTLLSWESVAKIEEIMKAQMNAIAKKTDGEKKRLIESEKLMDAFHAGGPESDRCTLLLTEGDGAANFAIKGIQDGGYTGALPLKGKLLNVGNCDMEQYSDNKEIAELKKALGLKEGHEYSTSDQRRQLRYGRLVIMTDQDRDGAHIRMLVLNFFRYKFPSLLSPTTDDGSPSFVTIMETPYLRVHNASSQIPFFYEKEYQDWVTDPSLSEQERSRRSRCEIKAYKGLGSSSDAELMEAFSIGKILVPKWDEKAEELMSIAFDKGYEDERKEWLLSWDPIKKEGAHASSFSSDTISHLVTNQLCEFSWVNVSRSTPSVIDGLKECQRKVLCVVLSLSKDKKVSQLKGLVSDQMHYRYGEEALYRTIVGMGNYCVGTNNIPLIKAKGQYDSRLGKKAAPDRYIYAARSPLLKYLFRKEDECILKYQYEGKEKIEPEYYYPILPLWAINGSKGIGTGFSTNIPAHNPVDIMKYIVWWMKVRTGKIKATPLLTEENEGIPYESPPELAPWYRNYQGTIVKNGNDWYSVGKFEILTSKKRVKDILVTEIPVTQTIKTYTSKLKEMKEKPVMKQSLWDASASGRGNKCPNWITGYKSIPKRMTYTYKGEKYIEVLPCIQVEGALCATTHEGGPLRALGLIEKISDSNITLLDEKSRPRQYTKDIGGRKRCVRDSDGNQMHVLSGIMNALDHYCEIRYNAYSVRREKMMKQWQDSISKLELQKRFIRDVLDEKIRFRDPAGRVKKKAILIAEIGAMGYPPEFGDMSIFSLTEEGINKIEGEILKFQEKKDDYERSSPSDLWYRELEELYSHL